MGYKVQHTVSVTILGAGAFGTSLATVLAHNGYNVIVWAHESSVAAYAQKMRCNERYLPGITLHDNITLTDSLEMAINQSAYIIVAIPVVYMREILYRILPFIRDQHRIITASKGIERDSLLFPLGIVQQVCNMPSDTLAVLTGPSFAYNLAQKELTGLVVASQNCALMGDVVSLFNNEYVMIQCSYDIVGTQVMGAFKNVAAIGMGVLQGLMCGPNTQALFMTAVFNELSQLVNCFGGMSVTTIQCAGIGDLLLTCYGSQGRNVRYGMYLGKIGNNAFNMVNNVLPEGVNTVAMIPVITKKYNVSLPLLETIYAIVHAYTPPEQLSIVLSTIMGNKSIC